MGYGTPFKNIVRDAEPLCAIARRLIYDTQRLLQTIEALERGRAGRGAPLTTSLRDEAAPPAGRSPLVLARHRNSLAHGAVVLTGTDRSAVGHTRPVWKPGRVGGTLPCRVSNRPLARRSLEGPPLKIVVVDNQIEPALKALKREMLKGGVFKEMKRRAFYEKPSVKRKRKRAEARRKRLKAARRSPAAAE